MKILTQISRILVGVLFILSGLIKANDTLGFSYKLIEYFEIFNWPVFIPYAEVMSMLICIFEVMCGVALLFGAYARLNAWLLLLMIIFFTWLTGYSAITGKVTDCGCFGDAVKLTPVQSFMKDVVLMILILFIFIGVKHIKPIFNRGLEKLALFTCLFVSTAFTIYTYMFLPVVDFLPYKIGNDITEKMHCPAGAPTDSVVMVFIYEKNGVKEEFDMNHIPADSNYKYVDRKDKLVREGCKAPIHDFKLYDASGTDYTDSLFAKDEYKLILVQKMISESSPGTEVALGGLAEDWQKKSKLQFWALTATSRDEIDPYRHEFQLPFQYYTMDAIPLKSMVRSNPGVILMKKSTVVKKWGAYNLPSYQTVLKYMK